MADDELPAEPSDEGTADDSSTDEELPSEQAPLEESTGSGSAEVVEPSDEPDSNADTADSVDQPSSDGSDHDTESAEGSDDTEPPEVVDQASAESAGQDTDPVQEELDLGLPDESSVIDGGGPDTEEIVVPVAPITGPAAVVLPSPVWMWWGWSMVALLVTVVAIGVVTGILGRAVVLDIVSFWPIFGLLGLVAVAVRSRFSHRIRAILPLLITTWLAVAIALHLAGWTVLPSARADMAGFEVTEDLSASLSLDLEGQLNVVGSSDGVLYTVHLPREGGTVSAPQALETATDNGIAIELAERSQSFWFSSSGWDVALHESTGWELDLTAPTMSVDLSRIEFEGGAFAGGGVVVLGDAAGSLSVEGDFVIRIPEALGVLVIGDAELPSGWIVAQQQGIQSSEEFTLTITVVDGSVVEVVTY